VHLSLRHHILEHLQEQYPPLDQEQRQEQAPTPLLRPTTPPHCCLLLLRQVPVIKIKRDTERKRVRENEGERERERKSEREK